MRSRSEVWSASLLFGALILGLSGCGTLSRGGASQSTLLASPSISAPNDPQGPPPPAPAPVAAAVAAETRGETGRMAEPRATELIVAAPKPDFVPVALELITPGQSPSFMIAFAGSVVGQSAPSTDQPALLLAQQRGTPEPLPDIQVEEYDPWESFNEKMFSFNYNLDKYVLKPVAKGYNWVMPDMFQQMIGHGFDNIKTVPRLANNLLRWNLKAVGIELSRFLINSTFGIGGLFDIAKQEFGLEKPKGADFGVTLGKWGLGPGPYLILPFLPPLTVRDGIGYAADGAMDPLSYVLPFIWDRLGMKLGDTVNDRSLNLDLYEGFEETTVDLYSAVRNGYLQRRYHLIKDGR